MEKKLTETKTSISRKNNAVTVTTVTTVTTTKPGKEPEVKVDTKVDTYEGDALKNLPEDLRKQLEDAEKPIDPKLINKKAHGDKFEEQIIDLINSYRKRHGAEPLKKSDKATKYAEERAKGMAEKDEMTPRDGKKYGECVSGLWSNDPNSKVDPEDVVKRWYDESKHHKFGEEPSGSLKSGNFTQMVWKDSKKFGVAAAKSNSNKIYVVACYDPPGNWVGEFKDKVSPAKSSIGSVIKNFISSKTGKDSSDSESDDEKADSSVEFNLNGVAVHNKYRKLHGVPPVEYSSEAATYAQDWANKLAKSGKFEHSPNPKKFGENLFLTSGSSAPSPDIACQSWYSEIKVHKFGQEPTSLESGHFTQMIWKATQQIGMGRAKGKNGWIVVANYYPRGNVIGSFTQNVPKPIQ